MKIIDNSNYYIWWLKNCSSNVSLEQIKSDIDHLIKKLNEFYIKTGDFCHELFFLENVRLNGYRLVENLHEEHEFKFLSEDWV